MTNLLPKDGNLFYLPHFLTAEHADSLKKALIKKVEWRQDNIKMYGKESPLPRLTAWYGDPGTNYAYSGIKMEPTPWLPELKETKDKIEEQLGLKFNSLLINYYRSGTDYMSWHSDDEKVLGPTPAIASLSLGEVRRFLVKHRHDKNSEPIEISPESGSLILMSGEMQKYWLHRVAKTTKPMEERINLTYRLVYAR